MTESEIAAIVDGLAPVIRDYVTRAQGDLQRANGELQQRVLVAETQLAAVLERTQDVAPLRERLAVLETRPPLPGPSGPAGQDGAPGQDGTPGLAFRGVFVAGQAYDRGHLVTWAGASWHCNEPTTTTPGDGSKAWTLMVKKGRDGRDGKDGPPGPPGPRGDNWDETFEKTRRR